MQNDKNVAIPLRSIEYLLGESVSFLNDPDGATPNDCEILFSHQILGFRYPNGQLTRSLSQLLETAARETCDRDSLILTFLVTGERRVHVSVVSPLGDFGGLPMEEIVRPLNADDAEDGVKATPNTPFWRGGAVEEPAEIHLERLPLGGTRATLVIPEAQVVWRG